MDGFSSQPISPATRTTAWAIIAFLVLPITIVFAVAVTDRDYLAMPVDEISFRHYANLFTSPEWLHSIWQSFVIASVSTAIAGLLGTLCAIGCWRISNRLSELVRVFMLLPVMVPTIVYALGIYQFFAELRLLDTYLGLIIAHAVTGLPYVVITVSTSLAGFDGKLERAALGLGASMGQTLRLVILPNIMPGVVSGLIFAFIHSWDELVITLFIAGRAVFTLPRRMWDGINEALDPTMAAVAAVLVVITVALLTLELLLRGRAKK